MHCSLLAEPPILTAGEPAIDRLIRSRRRTLGIEVTPDALLIVRAPVRIPDDAIRRFLLDRRSWIDRKQHEARRRKAESPHRVFADGEIFPYLGEPYRLTVSATALHPLTFENGFVMTPRALPDAERLFRSWYREEAARLFTERTARYATASGIRHNGCRISNAAKRWGSCSPDGRLSFNWRLIMAPRDVIDYVTVHELVHVAENNHSHRFWARVGCLLPDYRTSRIWLKEHGHTLAL